MPMVPPLDDKFPFKLAAQGVRDAQLRQEGFAVAAGDESEAELPGCVRVAQR